MLIRITALTATLALMACGGSQQPTDTTQTSNSGTSQPDDKGEAQSTPDDSGQAVDDEVPPGLGFLQAFKSNKRLAAGDTPVDTSQAKQWLDEFVDLTVAAFDQAAAAASCQGMAEAMEGWRMKAIPIARDHFAEIDAYVDNMSEEEEKALQAKMEGSAKAMSQRMNDCMSDQALMDVMQRIMADMQEIQAANQPAEEPVTEPAAEPAPAESP